MDQNELLQHEALLYCAVQEPWQVLPIEPRDSHVTPSEDDCPIYIS